MGCADVVPGVSGGTVALVTGIYDRLVAAIAGCVSALPLFCVGRFKAAFARVELGFLGSLFLGIALAIVSMAKVISLAMREVPELTWGLFLGLMLGSVLVVGGMVKERRWTLRSIVICSTMFAFAITSMTPTETSDAPRVFFFSGMVAIVAMILPGISGSFLLLIMGKYTQVMETIRDFSADLGGLLEGVLAADALLLSSSVEGLEQSFLGVLLPFGLGCVVGLSLFSWVLTYLLRRFRQLMLSLLLGLMMGSLHKLWPFREVTLYLHREGKSNKVLEDVAVMPYWDDPMHWCALGMIVFGFLVVVFVERLGQRRP
jgi:putative membrane protein